jgi:hypothetical protein
MTARRLLCVLALIVLGATAACAAEPAPEEIPAHRTKQIRDAAPDKPAVAPGQPRRVLIFNTPPHLMPKDPHKGYGIPYGMAALVALGAKTGAYEPVVSDDVAMLLPESLAKFDVLALNNTSGAWTTPSDEAMERLKGAGADKPAVEAAIKKSVLDFVSGGKGLWAQHYGISAAKQWPEFAAMVGATFSGHPWNEEVGIRVEEPDHPLVAAFGGKDFRLAEEVFQFADPYSRKAVRVLLSLDTKTTNMGVQWISRKDNDFALAWVKPHGKGRVFYTAIGHRTEHYWNPAILRFYLAGLQFAAGDLAAPCEPRP